MRLVAVLVLGLVAVACTPTVTLPPPDQNVRVEIAVQPAGDAAAAQRDQQAAIDVLTTRVAALGVGTFIVQGGEAITVKIGDDIDVFTAQRAVQANGVLELGGTRAGESAPAAGKPYHVETSLLAGDAIQGVQSSQDGTGAMTLGLSFNEETTAAIKAWSGDHPGTPLVLVLDGIVLGTATDGLLDKAVSFDLDGSSLTQPLASIVAILQSGPLPESWRQP
jgi:preprotein translocase subunit SecD